MNGSTLVIGAGTNLGGRRSILRAARDLVAHRFGVERVRVAPVWETAPMGPPQPDYLNTAFALDFDGSLSDALDLCLGVERSLGRERRERWGPRTLDLDLLWHASMRCDTAALSVPHRGLRERSFALDPLLALVPEARDPTDGASLAVVRATLAPAGPSTSLGDAFEAAPEGSRGGDRAERLAAAAEALDSAGCTARPSEVIALELTWPDGLPDEERLASWCAAVRRRLDGQRFGLRRVATLEDSARRTRAVLLGESRRG
ncbi:MAG: 2-amino-4-hydroxy-6-hydroxymethyldihydropteridine diphosphokinase [Deltaproteobacteria bacterium]|nr:2-amino-4-hydroxy-6-hydroxymethyldihydropteridine diphosphokinase [Myxococcales bacterium]MDP3217810.1 2-amino-4-hydroxy-6-hydroxymethyldihydropteridine diphosphokinase [Deltaproteobacteria bacterium]